MAGYISSNQNRFYTAVESTYAQAASVDTADRFPAVRFQAHQSLQAGRRMDKTGTRTFQGVSPNSRRQTAFAVHSYLTAWNGSVSGSYIPLFQSAFGAPPQLISGLSVSSTQTSTQLTTATPHGLTVGSAISHVNEIRFVTGTPDPFTLLINAPFSAVPAPNSPLSPTLNFRLDKALPSITLYDYWTPCSVSRIVTGGAVDTFHVSVNGDFHEFAFGGPAADLLDSTSGFTDASGLSRFPQEPFPFDSTYSVVPGHLGQVWLGDTGDEFFTLTDASLQLKNNISVRDRDYGSSYPTSVAPGIREVLASFKLLAQNDSQTSNLYSAAKSRSPVSAMLQLGQQQTQLVGIYLPRVTPEIPVYNDSQPQLQWEFTNNIASGVNNDEIYLAFA